MTCSNQVGGTEDILAKRCSRKMQQHYQKDRQKIKKNKKK